ncbi:MAG: ATP-binding cassette domain-containing protein [Pseudomonadota bacterium]
MLEARDVSITLGGVSILRGATLTVAPGRVTALVGPNGAGKSTLLACLSGALRPDRGTVRMDGEDPAHLRPAVLGTRRAVLDQSPGAAAPFTLTELVELGVPQAVAPAETRRITLGAIHDTGLSRLAERPIDALSGGERHRAHLARALAQRHAGKHLGWGRWLMLDEPTASLDLKHQASVLQVARRCADDGAGVLAVLHDLSLAAAMADTVAVMHEGRVVVSAPPAESLTPALLARVYGLEIAIAEPRAGLRAIIPIYPSTTGDHLCSSP